MKKDDVKNPAQTKTITLKTDELNPVDVEILSKSIVKVSNAFYTIKNSGLNERAIVLLLHDLSGVSKGDIKLILHNGPLLAQCFTK